MINQYLNNVAILIVLFTFSTNVESQEILFDSTQTIFNSPTIIYEEYKKLPQNISRLDTRKSLGKQMLDIGDVKLYVQQEGSGIPVVLLHGGPGSSSHYFHTIFKDASSFARVIYYDQRACGLSEYEEGNGFSVEQAVDDLENLRQKLKIDKWVILESILA